MPGTVVPVTLPSLAPEKREVSVADALARARSAYIDRLPKSQENFQKGINFMPGGNTRSLLYTEPFPVFMKKGRGNRLWDHDDHE
jgi:glutamate-1-semialdehyde 2,1-aminomutase